MIMEMLQKFLVCGMGGGLRRMMNFAPAQYVNILFMWGGIKQTTAPTAAQRWIWSDNDGDDFCNYGRKKSV